MKTGIIVYSFSGNTLKAAHELLQAMKNKGQDAELVQIKAANQKPQMNPSRVSLQYCPAVDDFDRLVFAAPVWAFSLCGVMQAYLERLPSLSGKEVSLFVTYALPLPWMGASRALKAMQALCRQKKAAVTASAAVSWASGRRQKDMEEMVKRLS